MLTGVDVVVETVFDGGADTEFHARVKLLESFGQQVRRGVPEGVFAFGGIPFEEFDGGVGVHGTGEVPLLAVYFSGEDIGGEARADGARNLQRSGSGGKLLDAFVRESYIHKCL